MQGEVRRSTGKATTDSEAQGKMTWKADHGGEEHLMGALPLLEVAQSLDADREVVVKLMSNAGGVPETGASACARDEADEV